MPNGQITVEPNDTRERMVLKMVVDGKDVVSAELATAKVDELIEKIGFARAALNDRTLSDPTSLSVLEFTIANSAWHARDDIDGREPDGEGIALGLRHAACGWLSFTLPHKEAKALGQWLVENADTTDSAGT